MISGRVNPGAATAMRFDHLVHWVPNLEHAIEQYRGFGFRMRYGGRNTELGTTNAAWMSGSAYIEVIAFEGAPNAAIASGSHSPGLFSILSAGGGALAFAILVDDVAATAAQINARGFETVQQARGTLQHQDGSVGVWTSAALRAGPAWAPFFINYGSPVNEWIQRDVADSIAPWSIGHIVIETPGYRAAAAWLSRVVGLSVELERDLSRVPLPGGDIVFVRGKARRVTTVALTGAAAPNGVIAGLRYARAIDATQGHSMIPPHLIPGAT
jgi:hypothetical protein